MTDELDQASRTTETYLFIALRNRQHEALEAPAGVGFCLSCGVSVEGDRRWCDAACRDEWEVSQ